MKRRAQLVLGWAALVALLVCSTGPAAVTSSAQAPPQRAPHAWTLNEALAQLTLLPRDAYLQYVALQLARRAGRFAEVSQLIDNITPDARREMTSARRRDSVDLFSIFTGALAVQESLQLDTMRAATEGRATRAAPTNVPPDFAPTPAPRPGRRRRNSRPRARHNPALPLPGTDIDFSALQTPAPNSRRADEVVAVASLKGPTVKSHPWEQMLAGRKPAISPLAYDVPEDFYFVEFRSLSKLLDVLDANDLWGAHLFSQAFKEARTQDAGERLKRQLAVQSEPALRPFYDLVVQDVAVTGSDPFVREGSDVTLIFRLKQPAIFKARMDAFLDEAQKAHADAKRTTGNYLGVDYVQLETPSRDLSVIAAEPAPDLHVRSNSLAAFRRVLEAIKGQKTPAGRNVRRLGDTAEFAYIRTLMPEGDEAEDGLVYMSDPFIRRLAGPELKLTERRRMLCYNHLRMIGHAAMLYRTEFGKWPSSLEELARTNSSPGQFGQGELSCPSGGQYALSADGTTGVCSHHGHALYLTPNLEIPVTQVSGAEADEYEAFLAEYNQYWRTYFDPIALRLKASPQQYRVETLILPLMDNSIYTGLAAALKGEPEPLDSLPVPARNIFSLALRFNKEPFLKGPKKSGPESDDLLRELGLGDKILTDLNIEEFLSKGLGNQAGLHVYDSYPNFDLNYSNLLGMIVFMGRAGGADVFGSELLMLAPALLSLNSPVYVALPVRDERVVDDFLERLDLMAAAGMRPQGRSGWDDFRWEFYKFRLSGGQTARAINFGLGPAKLRFFIARVGRGLYVASKPFILEDLAARASVAAQADKESVGHAMARVRARNWNEVLTDFNLSWAENERDACLDNLGPLADVSRALTSGTAPADIDKAVLAEADRLHAVHFYCPDGGLYTVSPDGKSVSCSVHGTALAPQQPRSPSATSAAGRAMRTLDEATATLTFLPEGLRAIVTINRK